MPSLSLDSLTLTDSDPLTTIAAAHRVGFDLVSLWLQPPGVYPRQCVTQAMVADCKALLAETGVRLHTIEATDLVSAEAIAALRPAIERGAALGAKAIVAFHVANPERTDAIAALRALATLAAEYGLGVNVEPVAAGRTSTLAHARDLIADADVDAGILFDSLHFVRTGQTLDDISAIDPALIRYVQMCDGLADLPRRGWTEEAIAQRLYPGEGAFPLADIARRLPRTVPWAVELPKHREMAAGLSADAHAAAAFAALSDLLDQSASAP